MESPPPPRRAKELALANLEKSLVKAVTEGDAVAASDILVQGANVNAENYNRTLFYASQNYLTPLMIACGSGHAQVVELLLRHAADVEVQDKFDVTAAHHAAEKGHFHCLKLILEAGANGNAPTKHPNSKWFVSCPYPGGTTPLHLAASNNHADCVSELILHGADYNIIDEHGQTSMYVAAKAGFEACVIAHLDGAVGRDILSLPVYRTGDTPLHECVRHGMSACIRRLLKLGSDVNCANTRGDTPFMMALDTRSNHFSLPIARDMILYGYNTDLNFCDTSGRTPLAVATNRGRPNESRSSRMMRLIRDLPKEAPLRGRITSLLIAYGATIDLTDRVGRSILEAEVAYLMRFPEADRTVLHVLVDSQLTIPPLSTLSALGGSRIRGARATLMDLAGHERRDWRWFHRHTLDRELLERQRALLEEERERQIHFERERLRPRPRNRADANGDRRHDPPPGDGDRRRDPLPGDSDQRRELPPCHGDWRRNLPPGVGDPRGDRAPLHPRPRDPRDDDRGEDRGPHRPSCAFHPLGGRERDASHPFRVEQPGEVRLVRRPSSFFRRPLGFGGDWRREDDPIDPGDDRRPRPRANSLDRGHVEPLNDERRWAGPFRIRRGELIHYIDPPREDLPRFGRRLDPRDASHAGASWDEVDLQEEALVMFESPGALEPFMTDDERETVIQGEAEIQRLQDIAADSGMTEERGFRALRPRDWRTSPGEQVRRIEFNEQLGHRTAEEMLEEIERRADQDRRAREGRERLRQDLAEIVEDVASAMRYDPLDDEDDVDDEDDDDEDDDVDDDGRGRWRRLTDSRGRRTATRIGRDAPNRVAFSSFRIPNEAFAPPAFTMAEARARIDVENAAVRTEEASEMIVVAKGDDVEWEDAILGDAATLGAESTDAASGGAVGAAPTDGSNVGAAGAVLTDTAGACAAASARTADVGQTDAESSSAVDSGLTDATSVGVTGSSPTEATSLVVTETVGDVSTFEASLSTNVEGDRDSDDAADRSPPLKRKLTNEGISSDASPSKAESRPTPATTWPSQSNANPADSSSAICRACSAPGVVANRHADPVAHASAHAADPVAHSSANAADPVAHRPANAADPVAHRNANAADLVANRHFAFHCGDWFDSFGVDRPSPSTTSSCRHRRNLPSARSPASDSTRHRDPPDDPPDDPPPPPPRASSSGTSASFRTSSFSRGRDAGALLPLPLHTSHCRNLPRSSASDSAMRGRSSFPITQAARMEEPSSAAVHGAPNHDDASPDGRPFWRRRGVSSSPSPPPFRFRSFRPTFNGSPSDFRPSFNGCPSDFRPSDSSASSSAGGFLSSIGLSNSTAGGPSSTNWQGGSSAKNSGHPATSTGGLGSSTADLSTSAAGGRSTSDSSPSVSAAGGRSTSDSSPSTSAGGFASSTSLSDSASSARWSSYSSPSTSAAALEASWSEEVASSSNLTPLDGPSSSVPEICMISDAQNGGSSNGENISFDDPSTGEANAAISASNTGGGVLSAPPSGVVPDRPTPDDDAAERRENADGSADENSVMTTMRNIAEIRRRIDAIYATVRERAMVSARDRTAAVHRDRRAFASADAEGVAAFFQRHPALLWYEERASGPASLQHVARHAVRSALGNGRMRGIHDLPLPQKIKKYLFLDSPDALDEDAKKKEEKEIDCVNRVVAQDAENERGKTNDEKHQRDADDLSANVQDPPADEENS